MDQEYLIMTIAPHLTSIFLDKDGIWKTKNHSAVNYPDDGNSFCYELEEKSYWFKHRNNCIISAIRRFPPLGTVLDIGGGNGFVSRRILFEGYPVTLLEPGQIGAWNARHIRKIPEVINATFEDVNFPDEFLYAVGIFDVLEHIENDDIFLQNIWRVLKPDGLVFLTLPACNSLWSASDTYAEHFRRYDKLMVRTLSTNLFTLNYFTYFFSVLLLPTLIFRVFPYRLLNRKERGILSDGTEFGVRGGLLVWIIWLLLQIEYQMIKSGKSIACGTSCLCVLQKKNDHNPI